MSRSAALASLILALAPFPRAVAQNADSGSALFDGARPRGYAVVAARGASGSAAALAANDGLDRKQRALLHDLLGRVKAESGRDPRSAVLLHQTLADIVRTPTGAEMAARFIGEHARAIVEFGAFADTVESLVNVKAVLSGTLADTDTLLRPPVVKLNRSFLNADPDWRRAELAGALGHELFGHSFECQRADKAGVTDASLNHYRGDEDNARLLGWLIGLEAGGPADDGMMWDYLRDPEAFHKDLETFGTYYAGTFSVEEMKDPVAVLRVRRGRVAEARASLREERASKDAWIPIIEHFVGVHGLSSGSFRSLRDGIDETDAYAAAQEKEYGDVERRIDELSERYRAGGAEALSREAASPYYSGAEERLQVLRRRLAEATAGRRREPKTPLVIGQTTWDQLSEMYRQDKKDHPEHWSR